MDRTRSVPVDVASLDRLNRVARRTGIYENRADAEEDHYEAILALLLDQFEENETIEP